MDSKGAKASPAWKTLGILQCSIMINNPVGISSNCILTTDNLIADRNSCSPNYSNPLPQYLAPVQDFLHLQQCKCFCPNSSLLHLGCTVTGKVARSKGTKHVKTHLAKQEHFLALCCSAHTINPCVELSPVSAQNNLLACYFVSLIQGHTILGTSIHSNFIKN